MLCISLASCISELKPEEVDAAVRVLGGLGLAELASKGLRLRVVAQGLVLNKLKVLEVADNYGVEVRYSPRIYSSIYIARGVGRSCVIAGGDLVLDAVEGSSSGLLLASCGQDAVEASSFFDKLWEKSRNISEVDPHLLGRTKDWGAYRIISELRKTRLEGNDEEDIADRLVRSHARRIFGIDDFDEVARRFWSAVYYSRGMSVKLADDPLTGLPITAPLVYYSVKLLREPVDKCAEGPCIRTTVKLLERALRYAPASKLHDVWRGALRNAQERRRVEQSPYLPALLILTGRVEVGYDKSIDARTFKLRR